MFHGSSHPVRSMSPAAGVADEPVEDPGRDRPAVVGRRADVVDRLDLGGQRLGSPRRPPPGSGGCPRARPRSPDARIGRSATDPRATRTSRQARARPSSRQARAMTTLLIAWARRVPTLRKRTSRPPRDRDPDAQDQLVGRERGPPVGRPRSRSRGSSARRAARRRRSPRRAPAAPAACHRPATRWRCCRRACRGSGSGRRRSSPPPRRAPAGARDTAPSGGSPCTSSARRG